MTTPRVLGLDLSLTATGVCLPDGSTRTLKTKTKDGDRRLLQIAADLAQILEEPIDLAVVEDLPTHAYSAGITGMVQGIARAELLKRNVPYVLVVPATLKKFATNKGNADKAGMAQAAFKYAERTFPDSDQCDAFWLRTVGLELLGQPEFPMPGVQRNALGVIRFPPGGIHGS